ncbi:MAG: hypothetical protein AAF438_16525 [Pseudomonadota bacterium]
MSIAVFLFSRDLSLSGIGKDTILAISNRLQPQNVAYPSPQLHIESGSLTAIINPVPSLLVDGPNLCLGGFYGEHNDWQALNTSPPDGSYALFRREGDSVEMLTDHLGARCIWYFFNDDILIASNSQRAITVLLRSFEPDTSNYPWMLSAGTLNFMHAWDVRVKRLPLRSRFSLDRATWQPQVSSYDSPHSPQTMDPVQAERELALSVQQSVRSMNIDPKQWFFALSGGYDSRSILLSLERPEAINTITWGTDSKKDLPMSDAYIAGELSARFKTQHCYKELRSIEEVEDIETVLDLFIKNSEGQLDNLAGYTDGFSLWKDIFDSDRFGIVRGDEALADAENPLQWSTAYQEWGFMRLDEVPGLGGLDKSIQSMPQTLAPELMRNGQESLTAYGQRLCEQYYVSMVVAPLNYMKTHYCEILAPLLSRRVIEAHHALPEALRTNKKAFTQMVESQLPNFPIATRTALQPKSEVFSSVALKTVLIDLLKAKRSKNNLPEGVLEELLEYIEQVDSTGFHARWKRLSWRLARRIRKMLDIRDFSISPTRLALRLYIVIRIHEIFCEDAQLLGTAAKPELHSHTP